jgi:sugar lactone lactonase YvrE
MLAGDVLTLRADGGVERRHVGTVAAALRPRAGGGAVLALERAFALEDPDGTLHQLDPVVEPGVRFNDGGCDPAGRFWCGTMAYEETPGAGSMFRLEPGGRVVHCFGGVTISNGLEWSPDGAVAYYTDTPTQEISVADAELRERRPFARVPDAHPDGLTVDAEGGVWVALYDGHAVLRFAPDGTLDGRVELPGAGRVTACTFGGDALERLFITTSQEGIEPGAEPAAGSLFALEPGVRGMPARTFAG